MKEETRGRYGFARYYLLTVLLSFLGWCFETGYLYLRWGEWCDCGFMTLPFCPIYGCTLLGVYFIVGTPNEARGLLKRVQPDVLRYVLYFALAFLIPSIMEYIVGFFFDTTFHIRLWSYTGMPYNANGYVCLPISLIWAGLIFLFMRFLFLPLKRAVGKVPVALSWVLLVLTALLFGADIASNVVKRL